MKLRYGIPLFLALFAYAPSPLPAVEDDIVISFEADGTPLLDFLQLVQTELGQQIRFNSQEVDGVRIQALGKAHVARSDFRKFVESTLYAQGFLLVRYGDTLLVVRTSGGSSAAAKPGYLKSQAEFVTAEQLPRYEGRWIVLTTSVALQHANVIEVVNMLQSYFTDPMIESVRSSSSTDSIVMTGFPQTLLNAVKVLAELDRPPVVKKDDKTTSAKIDALEQRIDALEKKVQELSER